MASHGPLFFLALFAGAGLGVSAFFLGDALWGAALALVENPKPASLCGLGVRQAQWDAVIRNWVVGGALGAVAAVILSLGFPRHQTEQSVP